MRVGHPTFILLLYFLANCSFSILAVNLRSTDPQEIPEEQALEGYVDPKNQVQPNVEEEVDIEDPVEGYSEGPVPAVTADPAVGTNPVLPVQKKSITGYSNNMGPYNTQAQTNTQSNSWNNGWNMGQNGWNMGKNGWNMGQNWGAMGQNPSGWYTYPGQAGWNNGLNGGWYPVHKFDNDVSPMVYNAVRIASHALPVLYNAFKSDDQVKMPKTMTSKQIAVAVLNGIIDMIKDIFARSSGHHGDESKTSHRRGPRSSQSHSPEVRSFSSHHHHHTPPIAIPSLPSSGFVQPPLFAQPPYPMPSPMGGDGLQLSPMAAAARAQQSAAMAAAVASTFPSERTQRSANEAQEAADIAQSIISR